MSSSLVTIIGIKIVITVTDKGGVEQAKIKLLSLSLTKVMWSKPK
jgi:hypothetical protein